MNTINGYNIPAIPAREIATPLSTPETDVKASFKEICDEQFRGMSVNDYIAQGSSMGAPTPLWENVWMEGELCCLFARTNLGKSILAVQIATQIAESSKRQRVLYLDYELSQQQFAARYTAADGTPMAFPENLFIATLASTARKTPNVTEDIALIEAYCRKVKATTLIIDNLTALCFSTEAADSATELMTALKSLNKRAGLSILLIGHTPKLEEGRPIQLTDLAGSMRLANLLDSAFSIGSGIDKEGRVVRYVKHLKARSTEIVYNETNVPTFTIEPHPLRFELSDFYPEYQLLQLLKPDTPQEKRGRMKLPDAATLKRMRELLAEGRGIRDICAELSMGSVRVCRLKGMIERGGSSDLQGRELLLSPP